MTMSERLPMDIQAVIAQLPHRYPFLLVDRVLECVPGKRIRALKNVTVNEPFFPGHFPRRPVMPGVMILEALAQAAGILAFSHRGRRSGRERRGSTSSASTRRASARRSSPATSWS